MDRLESLSGFFTNFESTMTWMGENLGFLILSVAVLVLWLSFQAMALHYFFFYKESRKPRSDSAQLKRLETWITIQKDQVDHLFQQVAQLKEQLKDKSRADMRDTMRRVASTSGSEMGSVESSFMTLGEIQLKQKIDVLRSGSKIQ